MKAFFLLYILLVLPWLIASQSRVRTLFGSAFYWALVSARALLLLLLLAGIAGFTAALPWGGKRAKLFFLEDLSLSMQRLPVGPERVTTRSEAARETALEMRSRLEGSWDIEEVPFGRQPKRQGKPRLLQEFWGGTDLSRSVREVASRAGRGDRVIIFSDGRVTEGWKGIGPEPGPSVLVHAVVAAESLRVFDGSIASYEMEEPLTQGKSIPLSVLLAGYGPGERDAEVSLSVGGRLFETKKALLAGGGTKTLLEFTLPPLEEGLHLVEARVEVGGEEFTPRNNKRSFLLDVKSAKPKVTLVSNAPDWDLSFLARHARSAREYEVTLYADLEGRGLFELRGPERYARGVPPRLTEDVSGSDVLVLHGDLSALPREVRQAVSSRLAQGGAGILLAPSLPWQAASSWGELAPFSPYAGGAALVPLAGGKVRPGRASAHAVLSLGFGSGFDEWEEIPPPDEQLTGAQLAPGYLEVLLTRAEGGLEVPFLVVKEEERVRAAVLLGKGVWRWDMFPVQFGKGPYFEMLAGGLLEWLSEARLLFSTETRPSSESLRWGEGVSFERSRGGGEPREVMVVINQDPPSDMACGVTFGGKGEERSEELFLFPGKYRYNVMLTEGGRTTVSLGEGEFLVDDSSVEFDNPEPDPGFLESLCRQSGGSAVPLEGTSQLIEELRDAAGRAREPWRFEVRREPEVYFALLFIFFLELIVRRRKGLP
jgi:hypothetical protein